MMIEEAARRSCYAFFFLLVVDGGLLDKLIEFVGNGDFVKLVVVVKLFNPIFTCSCSIFLLELFAICRHY